MTTEERVMAILARSNPVPDVDDIEVIEYGQPIYLAILEKGSNEMADLDVSLVKGSVTELDRESDTEAEDRNGRKMWWLVAALAALIIGTIGFLVLQEDPQATADEPVAPVETATDPASILDAYIAAYNDKDIDAVMELFTEESVVAGHPYSTTGSETGLDAIRTFQRIDMTAAAEEDAYTISNVEVSGDTVTWDHVWIDDQGQQFCKYGMSASVDDGKFVLFTFPDGFGCR